MGVSVLVVQYLVQNKKILHLKLIASQIYELNVVFNSLQDIGIMKICLKREIECEIFHSEGFRVCVLNAQTTRILIC